MKDMVIQLKAEQESLDNEKAELDKLVLAFEESVKARRARVAEISGRISTLKANIADAAVAEFKATGEKQLFGGIGIQERKTIEYDEAKALAFAREKDMFLVLDKKGFEKAAPSLGLDFMTTRTYVIATFPKEIVINE